MRGLTLVELLVVMVLASLLVTLFTQTVGLALLTLSRVTSYQETAAEELLQQNWFITSVSAIVSHETSDWRFVGDSRTFTALTLEPLAADSGVPTMMRWRLKAPLSGEGMDVIYSEGSAVSWKLASLPFENAEFEYLSRDKGWVTSWRQEDIRREYIPKQVRLKRADGGSAVWWIADLQNYHQPIPDTRDEG